MTVAVLLVGATAVSLAAAFRIAGARDEALAAKGRRRDVVADAQARFAFYDARIPEGVYSGDTFERWRKEAERSGSRMQWPDPCRCCSIQT